MCLLFNKFRTHSLVYLFTSPVISSTKLLKSNFGIQMHSNSHIWTTRISLFKPFRACLHAPLIYNPWPIFAFCPRISSFHVSSVFTKSCQLKTFLMHHSGNGQGLYKHRCISWISKTCCAFAAQCFRFQQQKVLLRTQIVECIIYQPTSRL